MFKNILLTLITYAIVINCNGQKRKEYPPEKPKLVIGLVVDQMRFDYLYRFWDKFGDNGFKRLVNKGTFCKDANYEHLNLITAVGHASISTGTTPNYHGIILNDWYDRIKEKSIYCVSDENVKPVGTTSEEGLVSPSRLLTTTFGDELMLANNKSKIISISLKDRAAILMAGHTATAAYWLENKTGNWISSSYYLDSLPEWVNTFNNKKLQDLYLNRSWNTLLPIDQYIESQENNDDFEKGILSQTKFPYDLPKLYKKYKSYELLKKTPFGNTITKDFAIEAIVSEGMGKDANTDILMVSFSATDYIGHDFGPTSIEIEDAYIRLDKEISHFLDFIDDAIGKENVLIFLTADHGAVNIPNYLKSKGIPAGYFNYRKALNLLNSYLSALYGNANWILAYNSGQIYLDRILIEDSKISLREIEEKAATFMSQFSGVANAMPSLYLEMGNFSNGIFERMQKNYNQNRSGDIILSLEPGWIDITESATSHGSGYQYDTHVPLFWYGWKIKRSTILREISICDIAPTVANFLNISFPSGCTGKIIYELSE